MDDYLYLRLLFWFAYVFVIAYVFLIVDLGMRISNRVKGFSHGRIVQLFKKLLMPKNRLVRRVNKKIKSPV